MATIVNIGLTFTKDELLAELRRQLPAARQHDRHAAAEHKVAEREYLERFRERCREAAKWDYRTAASEYFSLRTDRGSAPSCPEPRVKRIESAIAMVEKSNQSKYTLTSDGNGRSLYPLVTFDVPTVESIC